MYPTLLIVKALFAKLNVLCSVKSGSKKIRSRWLIREHPVIHSLVQTSP